MSALRPLRPHQSEAIAQLRSSLARGYCSPLLQLPTGAGKTVVAAHIVAGLRERLKRVCFCVPTIDLVDQTMERFAENGIDMADMGAIQGNHPWRRPHAPIQIATGQTLGARQLPEVDAVIIDEAHRRFAVHDEWIASTLGHQIAPVAGETESPGSQVAKWSNVPSGKLPKPFFVGLSATPWARGLGRLYDDLIRVTSIDELIEQGHLSPFKVFAPSHPDLSGVKTVAGDYHEGQLAERMNKAELVADVVTTWLRLGKNEPTLCFGTGRAHARALHDRFAEAGVPVAYVDAKTDRDERAEIGRRLASGDIKVVCNIGCLTTGIDWDVRCLILARPTKSESLFVQIIGRALRPAPGKTHALILDHSDTHLRLGMVTDIDHDELDDGKPKKAGETEGKARDLPLPKECLSCGGLMPAAMQECPHCGVSRPKPLFVEADGELSELGKGGKRGRKAPGVGDVLRERGKPMVFAQLKTIQMERARSQGWVAHTFRDIFGVWPRGLDGTDPLPADGLMRSFVRSKDIQFAKSAKATAEPANAA